MTSGIHATAMTLAALLEVDPRSPLLDPLAAGLLAARTRDGRWRSTPENLWSLVALAAWGKRAQGGAATAAIAVGGKPLATQRVSGSEVATVRARLADLAGDRLDITSNDTAHVTARVTEAHRDPGDDAASGFSITRTYLDPAGQPATSFKAGDLVTVRLAVTADARHRWIALVDPLPAGAEAVNPKLASDGPPAASSAKPDPWARWQPITWTHQNLRDDRVEWFADDMPAGGDTLTYQARATIDGSFTAMPATIEAMYQPDQHARTARTQITVAK